MLRKIREWLRRSPRVHLREQPVDSLGDLVDLIDRFLDDKTKYDWEWDDFISWTHGNEKIEQIRIRIAATERDFLSKESSDRRRALSMLIDERNRTAALIGRPARSHPSIDQGR